MNGIFRISPEFGISNSGTASSELQQIYEILKIFSCNIITKSLASK